MPQRSRRRVVERSRAPRLPSSDRDGDTIENSADKCPDEAEVWNGVQDDDGCPDQGGKPLVVIDQSKGSPSVRFARPVRFKGSRDAPEIEPSSLVVLRALASELRAHPTWIVAVGVRPAPTGLMVEQTALGQAFLVADALRKFTQRDGAAETLGWKAVEKQPGAAASGFGVLILAAAPDSDKTDGAKPRAGGAASGGSAAGPGATPKP